MKRAAILLQTGAFAKSYPTPSSGMYDLCRRLEKRYDSRRQCWLDVRTHDADLRWIVEDILAGGHELIIHIGHSMGDGEGLINFARLLQEAGKSIALACLIDPVPKSGSHFWKTEEPFVLPANIEAVTYARTKNKPPGWWDATWTPWGRPVKHPNVLSGMEFVANEPDVIHGNIDEHPAVHQQILDAIASLVGP